MDDMFGLARFKHNFSLRQPRFLVYRNQCPRAKNLWLCRQPIFPCSQLRLDRRSKDRPPYRAVSQVG
jgi:hypothetical protein